MIKLLNVLNKQEKMSPKGLNISTFSNTLGGDAFFKAIGHPLTRQKIKDLLDKLSGKKVAIYDPYGFFLSFCEIYKINLNIIDYYVQDYNNFGKKVLNGLIAQPITDIGQSKADIILIAAFDSERILNQTKHYYPASAKLATFDEIKIPDEYITNKRQYLNSLNFATNFAFLREENDLHTRLVTANYWSAYNNGKPITIFCCLFDENGQVIQEWNDAYSIPNQTMIIESEQIKKRFNLNDFKGQLFMHVVGAAIHDIVKYALDVYSDDPKDLSCTHDANSWPADYYAGLPAPDEAEDVVLWVQNSHPCPIPANSIGLSYMGSDEVRLVDKEIEAFGIYPLNTKELFPEAKWPQQFEIHAGKYFVRPRYEVICAKSGRRRMAHANVERTDLQNDPEIKNLNKHFGKSYILPAPILPTDRWSSIVLPTPMSRNATDQPIDLIIYDQTGKELARHNFGKLLRSDSQAVNVDSLIKSTDLKFGHMELAYNLSNGGYADGWLHGLFKYQDRNTNHIAETSFGAHIFNTAITYKNEPQSYNGPAPGLSTKLFLRLDSKNLETFCHLIYPSSTTWHDFSKTTLILFDKNANQIGEKEINIPCGGSLFWTASEMFSSYDLAKAKEGYIIIRDVTCRLFGYHGLMDGEKAFCMDHMFGF